MLMIGEAAKRLGVREHQLRRLCNRGRVPFEKLEHYRVFRESDLPAIRRACVEAGYLTAEGQEAAVASC